MSQIRIVLTAEDAEHCPIFRIGHKMVLSLPGVEKEESDQFCVYALHSFFPLLTTLSRYRGPNQKAAEITPTHLTCCQTNRFACCAEGNYASFRVDITNDKGQPKEEQPREALSQIPKQALDRKKELIAFLLKLPFFQAISEKDIEQLLTYFRFQNIPGGTSIIHQGEPGRNFFILLKGQVEVLQDAGTLEQKTLAVLGRGECFGEMSLLSNSPCSATVSSRGEAISVLSLSKEEFHKLIGENPSLQLFFAKLLAKRLERVQQLPGTGKQEGLSGTLETFPVCELIQTVFRHRLTGALFLFSSERTGKIFFDEGELINAVTGTIRGTKAFHKMLLWDRGRFLFRSVPKMDVKREIHQNTMALVLDGMRIIDEAKSYAGRESFSSSE